MGSRYARLLQLLWRKAPKRNDGRNGSARFSIDSRLDGPHSNEMNSFPPNSNTSPNTFSNANANGNSMGGAGFQQPGTFSWLDLGATWNFATQNNSVSGSAGELDDAFVDTGLSPLDIGLLTDYSLLEGDNPNLIF